MSRRASTAGRFLFVTDCVSAEADDIHALKRSEESVSLATFRRAIGKEAWRDLVANLGYRRGGISIAKDRAVDFCKGVYRSVPCFFLRHSGIEYIYTLNGRFGASASED